MTYLEIITTTDPKLQLAIAGDKKKPLQYKYWLAQNPNLSAEAQLKLISMHSRSDWVKHYLVCNPNIIPEIFTRLFLPYKITILDRIKYYNLKYKNSKTQSLLETYLLLL